MLGVLHMITKLTLPILLMNKLILPEALKEKILNLNFEVVFLKAIKHALNRFSHRAIQLLFCVHNGQIQLQLIKHGGGYATKSVENGFSGTPVYVINVTLY